MLVESTEIKDFNWLAGFTDAEGYFQVVIQKSVSLRYILTQHSRDKTLMDSFVNKLDCGKCYSNRNEVNFVVSIFWHLWNYYSFIT